MLQEKGGENKRKFPRVEINLPVVVATRKGRFRATLVNVSMGGCQLEGELPARVGEILAISCLDRPKDRENFQTRLVWAVPKKEKNTYGGMFWRADEGTKREMLQEIMELARPQDPMAVRMLID
jgi:hypothetical protein